MGYGTTISSGRQEQRPKVQCSRTCSPTTQTIWYAGQSKSTSGPSKAKIVKLRNWRPLSMPYPLAVCTEDSVDTYLPNSFPLHDVLYPALVKFTNLVCKSWRGVQNIMCACKNHPSDNRGPTNLPELQVSVSKSLQGTAELEYPKCSTRRSVAHCSRDVANGSMRMEASSYTSTSSVTRQSSCLAFPCRALPDQKYLLSSCIANSFLHVRSRITKMRGEGL